MKMYFFQIEMSIVKNIQGIYSGLRCLSLSTSYNATSKVGTFILQPHPPEGPIFFWKKWKQKAPPHCLKFFPEHFPFILPFSFLFFLMVKIQKKNMEIHI